MPIVNFRYIRKISQDAHREVELLKLRSKAFRAQFFREEDYLADQSLCIDYPPCPLRSVEIDYWGVIMAIEHVYG